MPFEKVGNNDYVSPSGKHFNKAQVELWHANGGKFPGQKTAEKTNELRKGKPTDGSSRSKGRGGSRKNP